MAFPGEDNGKRLEMARPFQRPPALHLPLKGPELPVRKKPLMRPLKVLKNGFCFEPGRRLRAIPFRRVYSNWDQTKQLTK